MSTIVLRTVAIVCAAFVLSLGCGGPITAYRGRRIEIGQVATYWVDPAVGVSDWFVQRSCERWERLGIRCRQVRVRNDARIVILANDERCVVKNERVIYATAAPIDGRWRIIINNDCFSASRNNRPRLRRGLNLTHEFGHAFGLEHVPVRCDGPFVPRTAAGTKICGRAIMNPDLDDDVFVITVQDVMMYRIRDRKLSALRPIYR